MAKKIVSALPEQFEDFEKRMTAAPPTPDPEPKADEQKPARIIGGMEETSWSGRQMWRCPRCRATTFRKHLADIHECKVSRSADDPPPDDVQN